MNRGPYVLCTVQQSFSLTHCTVCLFCRNHLTSQFENHVDIHKSIKQSHVLVLNAVAGTKIRNIVKLNLINYLTAILTCKKLSEKHTSWPSYQMRTHAPRCIPGSLTSGLLWSRWQGKHFRHSRCIRNPQFYVSGKRPIVLRHIPLYLDLQLNIIKLH